MTEHDIQVEFLDYSDGDFSDRCAYSIGDEPALRMPVFTDAELAIDLDPEWVASLDRLFSTEAS